MIHARLALFYSLLLSLGLASLPLTQVCSILVASPPLIARPQLAFQAASMPGNGKILNAWCCVSSCSAFHQHEYAAYPACCVLLLL